MSIGTHLEKIISATFGKDVRQAIHDAIKQVYDDATAEGNANMEMEMARGEFGTLNERLDTSDGKIETVQEVADEDTQQTTLYFLQNVDKIRTRQVLAVQGFYSVDDNVQGKYRILSVTGTETWTDIKDDNNTTIFQISSVGELRAVGSSKKLKVMPKHGERSVEAFGAKDDGKDQSIIVQAAINSTGIGTLIITPGKTFLVGDIILKTGIKISGKGGRTAGYSATTGMATLKAKAGAVYILKGASFSGYEIEGIFFDGNGRATHGISSGMSGGTIKENVFYQCNVGFGNYNVNYAGTTVFDNNNFKECNTGITNIRDSRVSNNFFYSNVLRGIYLPTGANDNIISKNKIEWNDGYGIEGYQADRNIIRDNIYDRNGKSGVKLNGCDDTMLGGIFKRNGADTTQSGIDQSHIQLDGCKNITFSTTSTIAAKNLDTDPNNIGVLTPMYSLYTLNNDGLNYLNADLSGCTVEAVHSAGGDTRVTNKDTIRNFDRKKVTVNAGATATVTLTGGRDVGTYSRSHRRLKVTGRNQDSAASYYGEKILMMRREGGNASVEVGPSTNYPINGGSSNFLDGHVTFDTLSFTTDTTGSYVTFTITNTTAYTLEITFTLTD